MANRADRRKMMREQTHKSEAMLKQYSKAQVIERLMQQGITPEDLKREYQKGYDEGHEVGFKTAGSAIVKACYAGIALALREVYHFGPKRCLRALEAVDEKTMYMLNEYDLVEQTLRDCRIDLDFNDPISRVSLAESGRQRR